MLTAQRDFFDGQFYADTRTIQKRLNRHGILHGFFLDFGDELNFHKLIGFVDLLCFFIAIGGGGVSSFAPSRTAESAVLARYYEALGTVSQVAQKAGARG